MKRNIRIIPSIALVLILASCSRVHDSASPSNNQNVLGMVIQAPVEAGAEGLILLKDGRSISPQSGFNPTRVYAGSKFLFSFEVLPTTGKLVNVHVTNFALATDSIFIPPQPNASDSIAFKAAMQGAHNCTVTFASVDYSKSGDTTKLVPKNIIIVVNGNTFESIASYAPVPGGNGIFYFKPNQASNLYFSNVDTDYFTPSKGYPTGFVLNGQYYYALFEKYIAVWTYTNNSYSGYLINR